MAETEKKVHTIDDEISAIVEYLETEAPDSEKYSTSVENLTRLTEIKKELEHKPRKGPSPDGILAAAVAILQIGAILIYESYGHIISSRATNFIWKGREKT